MKALFQTARSKSKSHMQNFVKGLLTTPINFLHDLQRMHDPPTDISIVDNLFVLH